MYQYTCTSKQRLVTLTYDITQTQKKIEEGGEHENMLL